MTHIILLLIPEIIQSLLFFIPGDTTPESLKRHLACNTTQFSLVDHREKKLVREKEGGDRGKEKRGIDTRKKDGERHEKERKSGPVEIGS